VPAKEGPIVIDLEEATQDKKRKREEQNTEPDESKRQKLNDGGVQKKPAGESTQTGTETETPVNPETAPASDTTTPATSDTTAPAATTPATSATQESSDQSTQAPKPASDAMEVDHPPHAAESESVQVDLNSEPQVIDLMEEEDKPKDSHQPTDDKEKEKGEDSTPASGDHVDSSKDQSDASRVESTASAKKNKKVDVHLERAYQYFDKNRVGYIKADDLELLFHCVGRNFSKHYCRELVSKVCEPNKAGSGRCLYYRQLVEKLE